MAALSDVVHLDAVAKGQPCLAPNVDRYLSRHPACTLPCPTVGLPRPRCEPILALCISLMCSDNVLYTPRAPASRQLTLCKVFKARL